jgi:hypothetical protein
MEVIETHFRGEPQGRAATRNRIERTSQPMEGESR